MSKQLLDIGRYFEIEFNSCLHVTLSQCLQKSINVLDLIYWRTKSCGDILSSSPMSWFPSFLPQALDISITVILTKMTLSFTPEPKDRLTFSIEIELCLATLVDGKHTALFEYSV